MFNNIIKNNSVLENKKSNILLYTIATLITLTFCSGSNEVYAMNIPALNNQVQNVKKTKRTRNKFTPEEDKQIIEFVQQNGAKNWLTLAKKMPGRDRKKIRERYILYLDPNINKDPWTEEEDELIIDKQKELGNNWAKMTAFFIGRTPNSLNRRYIRIKNNLKKYNNLEKLHSRKPEQLIQQPDQIATTLPVQEINSDKDFDEILHQKNLDYINSLFENQTTDNIEEYLYINY